MFFNLYAQLSSSDLHLTGVKDEDREMLVRILEVLDKCGVRSYVCENGIFEGNLSQWSLGKSYHGGHLFHGNYPCGDEVGFYFDNVFSAVQSLIDGDLEPSELQANYDLEIRVAEAMEAAGIPHYPKADEIREFQNRIAI